MASYVKYENGAQAIANKELDLFGTTDTLKAVIHSDAPTVSTDTGLSDLTQVTGTGYSAGGEDTQNDSTRSGGTVTMTAVDIVWTGGAGGFTAGRYLSMYDDTAASDQLLGYWDYASSFTVAAGETFTLDFGASVLTLA
jgi:hypothetical protein